MPTAHQSQGLEAELRAAAAGLAASHIGVADLTEARLKTGSIMEERCGDCQACVEACPVQAFTGRRFDPAEPLEARFKPELCARYRDRLRDKVSGARVCGLCVAVCPFGRKGTFSGQAAWSSTAFSEQLSGGE
jgi:epoxyqueuosine reductase QueG